jgi:spore germination protein
MRRIGFVILIVQIAFLSSCNGKNNNIVEEIAPTILYYFEKGHNEKYKVSTMVPPIKKEKRTLLTTEETLLKDINTKLDTRYFRDVKDGQLRIVFFSSELAKEEGIKDIINALYLDPYISDRIYLGVVDGDFNKLLEENSEMDYLLYREMRHNQDQGEIIVSDLHQFLKAVNSKFADPFLPYFKMEDKHLEYNGVALIKDFKMVDQLTLFESKILGFLLDDVQFHEVIPLQKLLVSIGLVNSKVIIKLDNKGKTVNVTLNLRGIINEYQGERDLSNRREQQELQKEIDDELQKETLALLKSFQKNQVDPLQLGLKTKRLFSQTYQNNEWEKAWPQYDINMDVDLHIKDFGTYQQKENGYNQ